MERTEEEQKAHEREIKIIKEMMRQGIPLWHGVRVIEAEE